MRLTVLALDYDGTIARNDVLEPEVRTAIADARERGIIVLIVTGRILDDLRRVAGDLGFVDAVAAERSAPRSELGMSSGQNPLDEDGERAGVRAELRSSL
jgi:phosphoglycolate phosphatase-like HAD superfamily hydrolase